MQKWFLLCRTASFSHVLINVYGAGPSYFYLELCIFSLLWQKNVSKIPFIEDPIALSQQVYYLEIHLLD